MGNKSRFVVIVISLILILTGIGCVAVSKWATPAEIDSKAVEYVIEAGVADAEDYEGWANLLKAMNLEKDVETAYALIMLELEQLIQSENLKYSIHKDVTSNNRQIATVSEEQLFGEKGLLSMGLSLAGFGTLTGVIGLLRKRPGDITPEEVKQVVSQATGDSNTALSVKEKQFVEVVKGVQKFFDEYKNTTNNHAAVMINALKTQLDKAQDTNTQVAVATIKKEIA